MSEPPPPGVAEGPAVRAEEALSPEAVAGVLADFRDWLAALPGPVAHAAPAEPPAPGVDLHTLVGQFIALRHEVNLQTRATRAQQEQNGQTLQQLTQALDALAGAAERTGEPAPAAEAQRPLLKTLVDLYDSLALAGREVQRMQESVLPLLDELARPPEQAPPRSFWGHLFGKRPQVPKAAGGREAAGRIRQWLASLVTGYTMSVQRVERALRQHGLEPMQVVGAAFDPERMEVVEVTLDSGRPSGEVLEEVRRGYLWDGRVFRYAQVRVAKS